MCATRDTHVVDRDEVIPQRFILGPALRAGNAVAYTRSSAVYEELGSRGVPDSE